MSVPGLVVVQCQVCLWCQCKALRPGGTVTVAGLVARRSSISARPGGGLVPGLFVLSVQGLVARKYSGNARPGGQEVQYQCQAWWWFSARSVCGVSARPCGQEVQWQCQAWWPGGTASVPGLVMV